MELDLLFQLAILLIAGLVGARLIRLIRLPDVTGYLILGLLIGPSVLGLFTSEGVAALSVISDVALGFIAFTVGGEFKFEYFRRVGATPIVIAFFESIVAVILVVLGLWATGNGLPFALVLGAIAAATAPAATIMVIKQYRAKGPVTETLLSVVALDDAVALIAFGLAVAVARTLESGGPVNLVEAILSPIWEVVLSVGVGIALGLAAVASIIAAMASLPKFAKGGIVSGPTLAMVGEYAGASGNPEVIAPLDKLRGMLAPSAGATDFSKVRFEIKGRTLVGILAKENEIVKRN